MTKEERGRYMASREWAVLKEAVKKRADGVCERCGLDPVDQVHHLTYERFGHELLTDLHGLCNQCHEFVSGKRDTDPLKRRVCLFPGIGNVQDPIMDMLRIIHVYAAGLLHYFPDRLTVHMTLESRTIIIDWGEAFPVSDERWAFEEATEMICSRSHCNQVVHIQTCDGGTNELSRQELSDEKHSGGELFRSSIKSCTREEWSLPR